MANPYAAKVNRLPVVQSTSVCGISRFASSRKFAPLQCIAELVSAEGVSSDQVQAAVKRLAERGVLDLLS